MNKLMSEIFAAPKGNLTPVWKYAGSAFYTSVDLKRNFIIAMAKTSKSAPIIKKIVELMSREILYPVYKDKSFWKSILKMSPVELQNTAGVTFPDVGKIFVFVEEGSNLFSFTSNDAIASVVLHELVHLVSYRKQNFFYSLFNDELVSFYKYYFCKLLSCDINKVSDSEVDKLVRYIYFEIENKRGLFATIDELHEYRNIIISTFQQYTTLSQNDFNKMVNDYIVFFKLIQKFESSGQPQLITKVLVSFRHIVSPLENTYKNVFKIDLYKEQQQAFQEVYAPSEIISIPVVMKKPNPKVYKAINQL